MGGKALKILEPELATRAISALDRFSTRAEQTFAQSRQTKIESYQETIILHFVEARWRESANGPTGY